jgi:hypothetical protein
MPQRCLSQTNHLFIFFACSIRLIDKLPRFVETIDREVAMRQRRVETRILPHGSASLANSNRLLQEIHCRSPHATGSGAAGRQKILQMDVAVKFAERAAHQRADGS